MDEKLLQQIGLPSNLAHIYRLLVERTALRPSQLAKITHESRANCYALLDKLAALGLAKKIDVDKKLTYFAESPVMLEKMLSEEAANAQSKLQSIQQHLPRMLSTFNSQKDKTRIAQYKGKEELQQMYIEQMEQPARDLYYMRSTADIPYFGYKDMQDIRYLSSYYKKRRYGISPVVLYAPTDSTQDARSNLKRTWLPKASYTAPVEWVVVGDVVHIIVLKGEGSGIAIKNAEIAEGLRQMLMLFSDYIKKDPAYRKTPLEVEAMSKGKPLDTLIERAKEDRERSKKLFEKAQKRKP
jgi:DNA-binding transcriptional regulator GbsR (MarR family)